MKRGVALHGNPVGTALRSRRAAVAVEFALVAAPFIFLLFAIIESGLIFVANINLSNATMALGRQLRTGTVMASGLSGKTGGVVLSLADFKTAVCNKMIAVPLAACTAQLQVDVHTASNFGSGSTNPVNNNNFNNSSLCFTSGSGGSIVEFTAYYVWPLSTPLLLNALINASSYTVNGSTSSGNFHVMTSAEAFRVEQNAAGANAGGPC